MRENLKKCRLDRNLSVEDVSKTLGISKSFYYKIESGLRNPTMLLAKQISNLLEEDIDHLFFNNKLDQKSNENNSIAI